MAARSLAVLGVAGLVVLVLALKLGGRRPGDCSPAGDAPVAPVAADQEPVLSAEPSREVSHGLAGTRPEAPAVEFDDVRTEEDLRTGVATSSALRRIENADLSIARKVRLWLIASRHARTTVAARELLIAATEKDPEEVWKAVVLSAGSGEAEERLAAVRALSIVRVAEARVVERLSAALRDDTAAGVREEAADQLSGRASRTTDLALRAGVVEALMQAAQVDSDASVRAVAIEGLGLQETPVQVLFEIGERDSTDERVRRALINAVSRSDEKAIRALVQSLGDGSLPLALELVARGANGRRWALEIVFSFTRAEDVRVRSAAVKFVRRADVQLSEAERASLTALASTDPSTEVRSEASQTLAWSEARR